MHDCQHVVYRRKLVRDVHSCLHGPSDVAAPAAPEQQQQQQQQHLLSTTSMSFKIASRRPAKVQKRISAFDEGDTEQHEPDGLAGSTSQAANESLAVSASKWIDKGSGYAEAGDAQAALRCWDQAALIQQRNSRLHEMRAQVLDQVGRTFEAVQAAQQAVSLEPDWVEGHITLARVQLNLGEPQLALASYMAAAKLQPEHPDLVQEVPNAQMLAKMQQQQPKGTRAHVVESNTDAAGAGASDPDPPAPAAEADGVSGDDEATAAAKEDSTAATAAAEGDAGGDDGRTAATQEHSAAAAADAGAAGAAGVAEG